MNANNMNYKLQLLGEMRAQIDALEAEIEQEKNREVVQWQPKGGEWVING